jgi:hypothetical protein
MQKLSDTTNRPSQKPRHLYIFSKYPPGRKFLGRKKKEGTSGQRWCMVALQTQLPVRPEDITGILFSDFSVTRPASRQLSLPSHATCAVRTTAPVRSVHALPAFSAASTDSSIILDQVNVTCLYAVVLVSSRQSQFPVLQSCYEDNGVKFYVSRSLMPVQSALQASCSNGDWITRFLSPYLAVYPYY